ncbi:MAG: ribonuclease J [Hyphomicrobiaceae bacterium]|nr:ribonuclease J [Hyphomicrobiaceae bacterium]
MARRADTDHDLVFLPLGGVGEIGMNCALYGTGPEDARDWIMVDCGVTFASELNEPGVDLVFPDIRFAVDERPNLRGIIITHAHEDHFGALLTLWPQLKVPVYMTPFSAGLLEAKAASEPGAPKIKIIRFDVGDVLDLGPFKVEALGVAHSIPDAVALAIHSPLGTVLHTGDWKIDETPVVGNRTDFDRLARLGDAGVLALVGDSTNAVRDGISPSEADVGRTLAEIIRTAKARVAVTTFASNIARIRSVGEAALAADRQVVVIGRAMRRAIDVARELGMLDGLPEFLDEEAYGYLPRDRVVALCTGSQGEERAALSRIADDQHKSVALSKGDVVIFSSRTIPGNEKSVNKVINGLATKHIDIVTDRDALVHVSGHPRREELARMFAAVRPRICIPVHGEALHLNAHEKLARACGVKDVVMARDGAIVRLAPGHPEIIDEAFAGRVFRDGHLVIDPEMSGVGERRKASFAGTVTVTYVVDAKGTLLGDPKVALIGLPKINARAVPFTEIVIDAARGVIEGFPKARRKDSDAVNDAVKRAVRSAVNEAWGKKPICNVIAHIV